jgi:hypothetical protein
MRSYERAPAHQLHGAALGVCAECGAGAGEEHLVVRPCYLTSLEVLVQQALAHPPARWVPCPICVAAWNPVDLHVDSSKMVPAPSTVPLVVDSQDGAGTIGSGRPVPLVGAAGLASRCGSR